MYLTMHILLILFLLCTLLKFNLGNDPLHNIQKRFVLFPQYSVLQITAGMSIPAILPRRIINLSFGLIDNRDLPFNISNFEPLYGRESTENMDFDRKTLYEYVVGIIDTFGFDGETCLLRTICDVSEIPLHTDDNHGDNLLEKILHYLLTPSEDFGDYKTHVNISLEHKVLIAEHLGKTLGNCYQFFKCPINLLDLLTNKYSK